MPIKFPNFGVWTAPVCDILYHNIYYSELTYNHYDTKFEREIAEKKFIRKQKKT